MNMMVASKIVKGQRTIVNRSIQTINAYSCELYIDSFRISYRGFVYFSWVSNSTQINSLRYESTGKSVQVKQTLTISVRVAVKNGKQEPLQTSLKLYTNSGQQLDQYQLDVNMFSAQFKEMEIPMNRGLCLIRIRKRQMIISGSGDIQLNTRNIYRSKNSKIEHRQSQEINQYQLMQEELNKIKKQLQDQQYLNNKLKNDRDVLLVTQQELQYQIQTLLLQITKEISILRAHYQNRMTIREHCYEEEIEDIVKTFNSQSQQNKKVVELVMRQKNKLQEEVKPLLEKIKFLQNEGLTKDQNFNQLQKGKDQINLKLQEINEYNLNLNQRIQTLSKEQETSNQQCQSYKNLITSLQKQISSLNLQINNQNQGISKLNDKINELQLINKNKDSFIQQLSQKQKQYLQDMQKALKEKNLYKNQAELLQEQKKKLYEQLEYLNGKFQQYEYEMQFNENVMNQLKKQQTQKQQQLYTQIQNLQKIYAKKMEDIISGFQAQKGQIQNASQIAQKQKEDLQSKLKQLSSQAQQSQLKMNQLNNEIIRLQNSIKGDGNNVQAKDDLINLLQKEIEKLKEQIEHLRTQKLKNSEKKSQKFKQSPEMVDMKQYQQLKNKLLQLQKQNSALQRDLHQGKSGTDVHDMNGKQEKKYASSKDVLENSRKSDGKTIRGSIHEKAMTEQQIYHLMEQKESQINDLRRKVQELQNLYQYIQMRFDKILQKYPQIDLAKIDQQVPKIVQGCDSEKEEERILNMNTNIGSPVLFNSNDRPKFRRSESIAEEIIQEENKDHIDLGKSQKKKYQPASQSRIKINESLHRLSRKESQRPSPLRVEIVNHPSLGKNMSGTSKDDRSQKSGTSYIRVSHTKKIKDLQSSIRDHQQKQQAFLRQIESYQQSINALKAELNKNKQEISPRDVFTPTLGNNRTQVLKANKQSQVIIEDERFENLMKQTQLRQVQYQKKNLRIGDLQEEIKHLAKQKAEKQNYTITLQIKLQQSQKRQDQLIKKIDLFNQTIKQLQKQLAQLQEKLRKQKQNAQEARLSVKQINLHFENAQNQLKKLRHQNQTLEQKVLKLSGSQLVIRQLTKQIEDLGKKQLQMTRTINHMKLQKDQVDEQLRMFKKRQNDHLRIASEWEQKAASLERQLQQLRRKQNKLKRQVQQGQQQVRRSKLQQKKLQQELQTLGASQVGWQVERRKHLDEISSLQDQLSRKEYELNKLTKQIEKWRIRAEEKDDLRLGKKNELKQEIQRLENELIRRQKRLFQETEQNKLLKGRLQLLQRQNKRIIQHKNQSYGQKLKYYVDEMSSIKKLLEQYQNENSRLKVQNNQLYEQSQMLRINYDKLEARYNQNIERQQDILNDLQAYINQVNMLKDRLAHSNNEIDQIQNAFANLHKQNDNQRLQAKKMAEKLEISQRNLQRAQIQIREYRVKQSQFETNNQINNKIGQKYRALQRRKTQLQQENKKLKSEIQNIMNTYAFKREDLQKAVNEARNQERKNRQQEMQRMEQDFNKTLISKTQRLQQEVLDVYNENNKLRSELQILMQQNGKQKGRLNELQIICSRIGTLQGQYQLNKNIIQQLKEEIRKKNEKINKNQVIIEGLASENNLKDRQINNSANRMRQLEKHIQTLNEEIKARKNNQRQLQDALSKATNYKQKQKSDENAIYRQREAQLIQQYQSKISTYQLQLQRAKDRQNKAIQQNVLKMKKLEQKMDEMQEALKQKQKAIIGQYEVELQQLQNSLMRLSQELQDKLIRQDELNEAIILLEGQNKELMKQQQQVQRQYQQQKLLIQTQLNKLKLKMKDAETLYANNLKALEEELIKATQARGNNNASSRVKNNEAQERVAKRFDQKLKNKDKKIQQLKQSIYTLEQTILKLKKKEASYESSLAEIQKYKLMLTDQQKQRKRIQFEWSQETNKNSDLIRQLRKQILKLKEEQEKSRLIAQEKIMEYQSTFCQLKTIKQLYQELQKELERRKHNLTLQMEEETSLQHQVRTQQSKIIELEQRLLESIKTIKELQNELKRKNAQIKRQYQTIQQAKKIQDQYKIDTTKLSNQIASLKKINNQQNITCDSLKSELKQSKTDYLKLKKNHDELKSVSLNHQQLSMQLKRVNQQLTSRYRQSQQVARRYTMLNQRSREQIGIGIEQIIQRYSIFIQDKDAEVNQLIQQIQELKFLNERKFMDYDQMKKTNFELQLKVQEYQTLSDQLDTLRKICDKLEQQKKNSVFREEVLRMQIQNLAANGTSQLRSRIQNILAAPIVPSYNNFSFY